MRTKKAYLECTVLSAALLIGSQAAAQTAATDCEKEPACMALWERAAALSKEGKLPESQRMYEMAYDLRDDPRLLFNIARILHKRGLFAEAAAQYERFLKSTVRDPEQKSKALAYLEEVRASLPQAQVPRSTRPEPPPLEPAQQASAPASDAPVSADPRAPGRRLLIAGGVLAGVGLLGALAGAGLYAAGTRAADQFESTADEFEKLSWASQVRQLDTGATIGVVVGSAFMAGGAAMLSVGAYKHRSAQRRALTARGLVVPLAGGAAVQVGGLF